MAKTKTTKCKYHSPEEEEEAMRQMEEEQWKEIEEKETEESQEEVGQAGDADPPPKKEKKKDKKPIKSMTNVMLFQFGSSPFKFKSFSNKFRIWNSSLSCFMCSTPEIY